jgi:hypothetical protein
MSKLDDYIAGLLYEDMAWEGDAEQVEQLERCRRELVEVMGFTREDVRALRALVTQWLPYLSPSLMDADSKTIASLADRIEALLPPE